MIFVDSNVPMYVAGRDHPLRDAARRFLARAHDGDTEICTSTEVLQEILYRYTALKRVDLATSVYDLFVQLCPVVLPVTLADTDRARALLPTTPGISVRDALHAAVMLNNGVTQIATFDEGFDRISGITRVVMQAMPSGLAQPEQGGLLRRADGDLLELEPMVLATGAIAPSELIARGRDE